MLEIRLNQIKIFAHHGFYEEEALLGSDYLMDISVGIQESDLRSDALEDTLNYEGIYQICQEEMSERSSLLEHVVYRIKANLISTFPHQVSFLRISLKKLNPPLRGSVESSEVYLEQSFLKNCAKCNQFFSCYNSEECWCKEYNLSDVTRSQLQRQYVGCLCNSCLSEFQETHH